MAESLKGVKLDLDALVAADSKLMKASADWPGMDFALDWLDKMLVAAGKQPIDREAIMGPGELFDDVLAWVKTLKPQEPKAKFILRTVILALDYLHEFVHASHAAKAGA